jgi:hypothetical protein
MRESCDQMGLAERAFFRYSRGGSQISGPGVHLARELARCWGNIQYGIAEMRRDDIAGESEMQAFAWDVQTNARASTVFVVKHGRDTQKGIKKLVDLRDIYENNANMGARRLREQIFAVLPIWFTEEAKQRCLNTVEKGVGEKPLPQRIADNIKAFAAIGVSADQLERKLGRPQAQWTAHDIAQLIVIGRSITNGEATVEDEFPQQRVTADDINAETQAPARANGRAKPAATVTEADLSEPTQEELDAMAAEMGGGR